MSVPRQSAAGSSSQAQSLLPSLQSDPVRLNDLFAPHKRTYDGKVAKNKKIPAKTVQKRSKSTTSRTASSSASVGNWPPGFGERSRVVSPPSSPSNEPTQGYDGQLHDVDDQAMNFGWDANDFYSHSALNEDVVSDLDDLATYKESLFESCGLHCERLTAKMWVLEGWKDGQPEVGRFYHISIINLPDSLLVGCECPQARSGSDCIHARLAREAWSLFNSLTPLDSTGSPLVVQIAQLLHGRSFWLSVAAQDLQHASAAPGLHKRCIVSAIKDAEWDCSAPSCARGKLPATACVHRSHASRFVYELHGSDVFQLREEVMADDLAEIQSSPSLILQRQAVSHVKIPPPRFALLPDEAPASAALEPSLLPALLALDSVSRCYACGASDGHEGVTEQREVRVYLVLEVVHRRIEVKRCICRSKRQGERRTVGPDLGGLGLFNLNNEIIISHAVLNAYSSQMLRSSTPLTAFHASSNDLYLEHGCSDGFLPKTTFLRAFYLFIELQQLPDSFSCPECGFHPDVVIADGVVLAHTLTNDHTLVPPTVPGAVHNLHPQPGRIRPFLPYRSLRGSVRDLGSKLTEPAARVAALLRSCDCTDKFLEAESKATPAACLFMKALRTFLSAEENHSAIDSGRTFFGPLLRQLAAEEGQLQLCRPLCLPSLDIIANPSLSATDQTFALHASRLAVSAPALGNLACYFASHPRVPLPLGVRILWRAIHSSVTSYLSDLGQRPVPPPRLDIPPPAPHHGVLYGAKQIRERPLYPGLKEDKRSGKTVPVGLELTGEGDVCNKYYKDYVIPRRSGGVMALWCRHAISVGFHCMPSAEGRDDVFSALFTRWPKPPSVVVYDFGCQLASYAVAREPDFFGDTLFVVDELHQKGHSSCTPSSWLSTYMANDPKLRHLNSSAAECGNSGLSRIKKSVSYSSATHAIAITRHFLSLWNRRKINVLLSEGSKKGNRK